MAYGSKSLIVTQDILFGQGKAEQMRFNNLYVVDKVNAGSIPYTGDPATNDVVSVKTILDGLVAAGSGTPAIVEW
jgi:hypothetical protein